MQGTRSGQKAEMDGFSPQVPNKGVLMTGHSNSSHFTNTNEPYPRISPTNQSVLAHSTHHQDFTMSHSTSNSSRKAAAPPAPKNMMIPRKSIASPPESSPTPQVTSSLGTNISDTYSNPSTVSNMPCSPSILSQRFSNKSITPIPDLVPGQAEYLISKLTGQGFACPHFPKIRHAEWKYPSRLGFFYSNKGKEDICYVDLSKLCFACCEDAIPRVSQQGAYNVWSNEGGLSAWQNTEASDEKQSKRKPVFGSPDASRRVLLIEAGTASLRPLRVTNPNGMTHLERTAVGFFTPPIVLYLPDNPQTSKIWDWLRGERAPFYIDELHSMKRPTPWNAKIARRDAEIANIHGTMYQPPPKSKPTKPRKDGGFPKIVPKPKNEELIRKGEPRVSIPLTPKSKSVESTLAGSENVSGKAKNNSRPRRKDVVLAPNENSTKVEKIQDKTASDRSASNSVKEQQLISQARDPKGQKEEFRELLVTTLPSATEIELAANLVEKDRQVQGQDLQYEDPRTGDQKQHHHPLSRNMAILPPSSDDYTQKPARDIILSNTNRQIIPLDTSSIQTIKSSRKADRKRDIIGNYSRNSSIPFGKSYETAKVYGDKGSLSRSISQRHPILRTLAKALDTSHSFDIFSDPHNTNRDVTSNNALGHNAGIDDLLKSFLAQGQSDSSWKGIHAPLAQSQNADFGVTMRKHKNSTQIKSSRVKWDKFNAGEGSAAEYYDISNPESRLYIEARSGQSLTAEKSSTRVSKSTKAAKENSESAKTNIKGASTEPQKSRKPSSTQGQAPTGTGIPRQTVLQSVVNENIVSETKKSTSEGKRDKALKPRAHDAPLDGAVKSAKDNTSKDEKSQKIHANLAAPVSTNGPAHTGEKGKFKESTRGIEQNNKELKPKAKKSAIKEKLSHTEYGLGSTLHRQTREKSHSKLSETLNNRETESHPKKRPKKKNKPSKKHGPKKTGEKKKKKKHDYGKHDAHSASNSESTHHETGPKHENTQYTNNLYFQAGESGPPISPGSESSSSGSSSASSSHHGSHSSPSHSGSNGSYPSYNSSPALSTSTYEPNTFTSGSEYSYHSGPGSDPFEYEVDPNASIANSDPGSDISSEEGTSAYESNHNAEFQGLGLGEDTYAAGSEDKDQFDISTLSNPAEDLDGSDSDEHAKQNFEGNSEYGTELWNDGQQDGQNHFNQDSVTEFSVGDDEEQNEEHDSSQGSSQGDAEGYISESIYNDYDMYDESAAKDGDSSENEGLHSGGDSTVSHSEAWSGKDDVDTELEAGGESESGDDIQEEEYDEGTDVGTDGDVGEEVFSQEDSSEEFDSPEEANSESDEGD